MSRGAMESQKLISVVVPVYCEEAVIEQTYEELTRVMRALPAYRYELIFIDDGSADGTGEILRRLGGADPRAKTTWLSASHSASMRGMSEGGSCRSASIVTTASPRARRMPAVIAAW